MHGIDRGVLAKEPASAFCQWGASYRNQLNFPLASHPTIWDAGPPHARIPFFLIDSIFDEAAQPDLILRSAGYGRPLGAY